MPLTPVLSNEKGAALITALMLTTLSLVIATALMYSVLMATRVSASQKRYKSVLSATYGGVELATAEILPLFFTDRFFSPDKTKAAILGSYQDMVGLNVSSESCLSEKVNNPTSRWSANCPSAARTADPAVAPDIIFKLKGLNADKGYTIKTKIVDTVPGNSDKNSIDYLDVGSAVAGNDDVVHPQHVPALFNISVQGEGEGNIREKARLTVLYAY